MATKELVKGQCGISKCVYDVYTKEKTDELLNEKSNATDVYTKTEADALLNNKANASDVFVKGNYATLTGSVSLTANTTANIQGNLLTYTSKEIAYPSGFNKNNCIVIAFGSTVDESLRGWIYGQHQAVSSKNGLLGSVDRIAKLMDSSISIELGNFTANALTVKYKIVLMKIA